jgi:hypothetical protein
VDNFNRSKNYWNTWYSFHTDEKIFYVSPPVNSQNNRVWSRGRKRDVDPRRLLVQRANFSPHVMVSAGVCFGGKGRLHVVSEKVKVNADFCVNDLLPKLIEDCESLLPNNFVLQQDCALAHSSRLAQEWIGQHSPEFVKKDEWPPNSPDLNPLDYHVWGAMLQRFKVFTPKPTNKAELKTAGGNLGRLATRGYRPGCASIPEEAIGVHSSR